jgi:hypothetical protein
MLRAFCGLSTWPASSVPSDSVSSVLSVTGDYRLSTTTVPPFSTTFVFSMFQ